MKHANDNGAPATAGAPLTFISMFSGIEAASVAFKPLGWRALAVCEIDKAASRLLAYHYPDVPNLGDMSKVDWSQYRGKADIVCGGPPCQAFSVAGLRGSLDDARGNLSLVYMKALHAIEPRNAIVENVPGWLNTPDNAFGCFLAGLVGADDALPPPAGTKWPDAGMVSGPKGRAAWRIQDAQFHGLAQRRKRVLVVADFGNGADPCEVLFERAGVPRHSEKGREAGEDVAGTISARTQGGGGLGTDFDLAGGVQVAYAPEIARCVATREGSSQDYESTTMVACVTGDITHTLKAEGADASEDGTGRGTPIVCFDPRQSDVLVHGDMTGALDTGYPGPAICFTAKDYGADAQTELAPTLRAGGHKDSHQNGGVGPAVAYGICRDAIDRSGEGASGTAGERGGLGITEELSPTLKAKGPNAVAQTVALRGREGGATAELGGEVATALRASSGGGDKPHVLTSAVRRLTPRECERLQGFPDDYTRIPVKWYATKKITKNRPEDMWEPDVDGGWWLMTADGPRYKQLGNSWAVPKFRWLGRRIQDAMPLNDNKDTRLAA